MDDLFNVKLSTENVAVKKLYDASITWKIKNFARQASGVGQYIQSPEFWCSLASWALFVYPNGTKGSKGIVNISVGILTSKYFPSNYVVDAKFTVPCSEGQDKTCEFYKNRIEGAFVQSELLEIMKRERLLNQNSGYLENGCLTIKCDMTVLGDIWEQLEEEDLPEEKNVNASAKNVNTLHLSEIQSTEKEDASALLADIEALHNNPRFADVILKLGKHEFPAHKLILRSRSKVFDAMFEHDMQENRRDSVDLVDMEVDTVKDMLSYIYSGKIRQLSPEETLSLYVAADRYDLQGLVLNCRKSVLNQLSTENICETAAVADLHNDQLLMDAVKSLLFKNMKEVFATEKWMRFSKENQALSLNLIQSAVMNN